MRLTRGDFAAETTYDDRPLERAQAFRDAGARFLHVVDLEGARDGQPANLDAIVEIVESVDLSVQVGGGIRDPATAERYLQAGVDRIVLGTLALERPDEARGLADRFAGKVLLGIDLRHGLAAVSGWTRSTGRTAEAILEEARGGPFAGAVVTDIARDGVLGGPALDLYRHLCALAALPIVASGGVSSLEDVRALTTTGVSGIVIGKALYEGQLDLGQALAAVAHEGSPD